MLKAGAIALAVVAAAVAGLGAFLRLDKTHVFYRVRGEYRGIEVLETWPTALSTVRRVELENHRGEAPATALVRRPHELAGGYKIVLVYAGVKTREKILELIPERPDVVLVAPQYPRVDAKGVWRSLQVPGAVRRAAFRTVAGGLLATRFLEQTEGLDLSRLTVIGSSIGTAFAALHGALDERVPRVVLIHGGGDFPKVIRYMERHRGRRWSGEAKALLAELVADTFDPLHWVPRISPRELILIGARDDTYFPAASTLELYARAGEPRTLIWMDSAHVRSRQSETVERILELVDERLEAGGATRSAPPGSSSGRPRAPARGSCGRRRRKYRTGRPG